MAGYEFIYLNDREHVKMCGDVPGILFLGDLEKIAEKVKGDRKNWFHADYISKDDKGNRTDYYTRVGGGLIIIGRRAKQEGMPLFSIHLISPESKTHLKSLTEELGSPYNENKIRVLD